MTTVMVVEDEQSLREPLVYLLEKEGYEVLEAAEGTSALEIFKTQQIDLILLDIMMPGMSGNEVCRVIRQTSNVPVIMLTGHGALPSAREALVEGAFDYLAKPCDIDVLSGKITEVAIQGQRHAHRFALITNGDLERPVLKFLDQTVSETGGLIP